MFSKADDKNLKISQIHHKKKDSLDIYRKILAIGSVMILLAPLISAAAPAIFDEKFSTVSNIETGIETKDIQKINITESGTKSVQEVGSWQLGALLKILPKKVHSNVWGASSTERQSGTLKTYIYYRTDGHFGWEWSRPSPLSINGHILPIYPEVAIDSESTYFPIKLRNVNSLTAELEYTYTKAPLGSYNFAYDIFIVDDAQAKKAEIMIWLDCVNGCNPGSYGGQINDGYNTYNLYYTNPDAGRPWQYYAFVLQNQDSSYNKVNIKALLNKLAGKINIDWNIRRIELGNEVWRGSGKIDISKYLVNINGVNIIQPQSYISVNTPNGGENLVSGTTKNIGWTGSNSGSYIKIELLKGGVLNKVVTSSTPNDGSYSWTIPSTQTLGSDYKVRVTSTSNSAHTDVSNNNFVIRNPYISVTSPNGGESWGRGTTHTVSWTSVGSAGSYVKIELFKSGTLNRVISSSTPNDGSFSWIVSSTQTLGTDYKIKVTSTSNSAYNDWGNNNFKIY